MGITDGTFVCALCGEWRTGCNLCEIAPLLDMRRFNAEKARAEREAEQESWRQERAIRRRSD